MSLVAERRRRREFFMPEPERKRICKSLEPSQDIVCCLSRKCPTDYWDMEEDLKQKRPLDSFNSKIMKENPNSMIFPDNEIVTTAQPCPRCIAGEPGPQAHQSSSPQPGAPWPYYAFIEDQRARRMGVGYRPSLNLISLTQILLPYPMDLVDTQ